MFQARLSLPDKIMLTGGSSFEIRTALNTEGLTWSHLPPGFFMHVDEARMMIVRLRAHHVGVRVLPEARRAIEDAEDRKRIFR